MVRIREPINALTHLLGAALAAIGLVFGFHEIWHLFVMAASFSHYWAVLAYVSHTVRGKSWLTRLRRKPIRR